jgi:DNA polymerase I
MQIVRTANLNPRDLNSTMQLLAYNGLDCCVTEEVLRVILPQLNPQTAGTYDLSRALQGPILDMNSFGLRVDEDRREATVKAYRETIWRLTAQLNEILLEGLDIAFPPSKTRKYQFPSDDNLKHLFYNVMGLPPVYKGFGEERRTTVDRKALETLEQNFYAEPIIGHILLLRDLVKKVSFLETGIDPDGRLRTSFNIAGTTTGRLASSFSDWGTGTNLQNVENQLRAVFVADRGTKFCNIDLEQADARGVGAIHWNLFRDPRFLDACESGDLHTSVARSGFPSLSWTGDIKLDRALADGKFYREFSYRDAAKRLGHGTNYQGQADKMARETHIRLQDVTAFQQSYLKQFPAFPLWWEWVERQIWNSGKITTLLGRERRFFGHPNDSETIRAAVAFEPQSITADTINRGMLAVWRTGRCQLLLQVHDSILFQFPEDEEDELVPAMLRLVEQQLVLKDGRPFVIPAEAKVGWNWSDSRSDPDALRKFNDPNRPARRSRNP